jgi:hypothetical protein
MTEEAQASSTRSSFLEWKKIVFTSILYTSPSSITFKCFLY